MLFCPLWALKIDDIIAFALEHNPSITEQIQLLEAARYNTLSSAGTFYPHFDAGSYYQRNRNNMNPDEANISLRYNLFKGFSDYYNTKSALASQYAQQHKLEAIKQDVVLSIKTAYIALLQQKQQLFVSAESIKLLEQQLKETQDFFDVGLVPKNDVLTVLVSLSNAKQTYLAAKSNLAYLQKSLERYAGRNIEVNQLEEIKFDMPKLTLEELESLMLKQRSELKALQETQNAQQHKVSSTKGGFLPNIDIIGEQSIGLTNKQEQTSGRIEMSLNLFNGFATHYNTQKEKATFLSLSAQMANLKQELSLQLFNAYEAYTLALSAFNVAKESLIQAEENYRIVSNRYKERIETTSNLLDAELLLTQARTNVVINQYGISLAIAQIMRIVEIKD